MGTRPLPSFSRLNARAILNEVFANNFKEVSMSETTGDKIMGFVPKRSYVKITYLLLLTSTGGSLLLALFGMLGIFLPLGIVFTLVGLVALILALLGVFVFKRKFTPLDQAHLVYLAILFGVFFVVGLIVAASLFSSIGMLSLFSICIGAIQLIMFYTGFNSWIHGRTITKDNIKGEVQLALKRA